MHNLIFLFSLPRSGSTLLQRILSADTEISSATEPWVILPLVYALKQHGTYTEYSHYLSWQALEDFLKELPDGRLDYLKSLGEGVKLLYARVSDKEAKYFLDKTPRYALISNDVIDMFPDGKFIFLWRNPLAIIASMIETWGKGSWNIFMFKVDLFDGMPRLVDAYRKNSDASLAVRYESFLQAPERELSHIMNYLDLDFDPDMLNKFHAIRFSGVMGDPMGVNAFDRISTDPLNKWKTTINSPLRRIWCRRYLRWLGQDRLGLMGYDLDELLTELSTTKTSWTTFLSDIVWFSYGLIYCLLDMPVIKQKLCKSSEWKWVKRYS